MKKNYSPMALFLMLSTLFSVNLRAQSYCAQQAISTADDEIFNVTIGTLNNSSTCGQTGPGPGSMAFVYNNYTTLTPPNLTAGQVYTLSVTGGNCSFAYSGQIYVWIDYNQNGVLNDPGEFVWQMGGVFQTGAGSVYSNTIMIPAAPPAFGITRMRVTLVEGSLSSPPSPCVNYSWGETEDYLVNIIASVPCSNAPSPNTVVPATYSTCPVLLNPNVSLASSYTVGGITYQWQSSTVSPVGPFTPVANATMQTAPVPTLNTTTWYQAVITCTNSNQTYTTAASQYYVAGTTTNGVPYYEDFENIQGPNRLPNCSWFATNLNTATQTYTSSNSNNRVPRSGSKFAAFQNSPVGTNYFWTNGIQLEPGITYSAGLWFTTEYFGYTNWTNLSILVGANQTTTGLTPIASISPAVSGPYKDLGGMFTIPSSGLYYIVIRATSASGSAVYLSWDDLSVTIPCTPASGNSPTVSVSASNTMICSGDQVSINATGASGYLWNTGANTSGIAVTPVQTGPYSVVGTNTITGCSQTVSVNIVVNASPNVWVVADKAALCPGESAYLTAYGGQSYMWSNNATGNVVQVNPASTTIYSVVGSNASGCTSTGVYTIQVKPTPTLVPTAGNGNDICAGEYVNLSATGAVSYSWNASSNSLLYVGNPVSVQLFTPTTFTVMGTGANGCTNKTTVSQNVQACTGLTENNKVNGLKVYPNPTNGLFTVEVGTGVISSVQITDISGRLVYNAAASESSAVLNISDLKAGVYYVKVTTESASDYIRIVKM